MKGDGPANFPAAAPKISGVKAASLGVAAERSRPKLASPLSGLVDPLAPGFDPPRWTLRSLGGQRPSFAGSARC